MMPNVDSVFRIPEKIAASSLLPLLERFTGNQKAPDLHAWQDFGGTPNGRKAQTVTIGLVAKEIPG